MQMAAAWWLAVAACFGLAFTSWTIFALAGAYLLAPTLVRKSRLGSLGLSLLGWMPFVGGRFIDWMSLFSVISAWDKVIGLVAVPVVLALAGRVLRLLYPIRTENLALRQLFRIDPIGGLGGGVAGKASARQTFRFASSRYLAGFARDCRTADPGKLLAHALGPTTDWRQEVRGMGFILGMAVLLRIGAVWFGTALRPLADQVSSLALFGMAFSVAFGTSRYGRRMGQTVGEQALLRLTPLAGAATLLNRRLGAQLLRLALLNWAALTATLVLATMILGAGREVALRELALCCLAGQASMLGLLCDRARGEGQQLRWGVMAAASVLLAAAAFVLARMTHASPWAWMIALSVGFAASRLWYDWRRMLAALPAYPAGRLA
jgi:hypothetical protein